VTATKREQLVASVRQRLLNIANRDRVDFQGVLIRYGLERFLFRLGQSPHRNAFLLKGAFLFPAWRNDVNRPTRDVDLLGQGSPDPARLEIVVSEIVSCDVVDDGLDFPADNIRGEVIREASLYDGIRIKTPGQLGRTRIPLQIDIGFGDAAVPAGELLEFPTLLDQEPPRILAYRPEYVVAEKLEAMVVLGMINTQLKDYYDLWKITRTMGLSARELAGAVAVTFSRRGTPIPDTVPPALSEEYCQDDRRRRMWDAFLDRNGLDVGCESFESIVRDLRSYLMSILAEAREQD